MADGITYGINFPFRDSRRGDYLELTELESQEIKADLIHLLLTRKGSRYFLPQFGTRLYEFLFEPFDGLTFNAIESDIRDAIETFMPNLLVNSLSIFITLYSYVIDETNNVSLICICFILDSNSSSLESLMILIF